MVYNSSFIQHLPGNRNPVLTRLNKPGSERQIPYDLPYKWNLMNKRNKQEK